MRQQLPRKSGKTLRKGRLSPMRLFDVLGPVMIGPSSSHTAGAAKIGYTAQKLLGEVPAQADIGLYGSFATTGKGHGTDRALVAGLLGLRPDDPRLPDSFALAAQQGICLLYTSHRGGGLGQAGAWRQVGNHHGGEPVRRGMAVCPAGASGRRGGVLNAIIILKKRTGASAGRAGSLFLLTSPCICTIILQK